MSAKEGRSFFEGSLRPNREDYALLAELVRSGKVNPVVDARYPLPESMRPLSISGRYTPEGRASFKWRKATWIADSYVDVITSIYFIYSIFLTGAKQE